MNVPQQKQKTFYVTVPLLKCKASDAVKDRKAIFHNGGNPKSSEPHFTLMTIVPVNGLMEQMLKSDEMKKIVDASFTKHLLDKSLITTKGHYDTLGKGVNRFWVKRFEIEQSAQTSVGDFRKEVYAYITNQLWANHQIQLTQVIGNEYVEYKYFQNVFYKVPRHSWGHDPVTKLPIFKPHLSIVNIGDLQTTNQQLYNKLVQNGNLSPNVNDIMFKYITDHMNPNKKPMIFSDVVLGKDTQYPTCSLK
jgi:hypothetical protein